MCMCVRLSSCVYGCVSICTHVYVHEFAHNSYLTVIGVHEMHSLMHPNCCQITDIVGS